MALCHTLDASIHPIKILFSTFSHRLHIMANLLRKFRIHLIFKWQKIIIIIKLWLKCLASIEEMDGVGNMYENWLFSLAALRNFFSLT
jgi:hypothetical protein